MRKIIILFVIGFLMAVGVSTNSFAAESIGTDSTVEVYDDNGDGNTDHQGNGNENQNNSDSSEQNLSGNPSDWWSDLKSGKLPQTGEFNNLLLLLIGLELLVITGLIIWIRRKKAH